MTTVDCATKKLWLAEAELALHRLRTGSKEEEIQFGSGKRVKYTVVNLADLQRYIDELRDQVADCEGLPRRRRGPIRFTFGR